MREFSRPVWNCEHGFIGSALPTIPILLLGGEPDARLDLRAVLDRVYDEAEYRYFLYDSIPEPPLTGADLEWADRVRAKAPSSGGPS